MALRFAWLRPSDEVALRSFLTSDSPLHSGLLAFVEQGILRSDVTALVGVWNGRRLEGVLSLGQSSQISRCESQAGLDIFARCLCAQPDPLIMLSGPAAEVQGLRERVEQLRLSWSLPVWALAGPIQHQELMVREHALGLPRSSQLRPAVFEDLEALVEADLNMVRDELGFNPFAVDLAAHRRGVLRRITERRTWLMAESGGPIRFKVDLTACSDEVVQLAGVYTHQAWRQQGLAKQGVGELCALLLRHTPKVALHVSTTNQPALALYRGLGFRVWAPTQTVWFKPLN